MPYELRWSDDRVCVGKKGETESKHCYGFTDDASKAAAESKAKAYMRALYAHEPQASIIFESANTVTFELQASEEGDILIFRNAVLAAAEENANHDVITREGIGELAATIAGRPIDDEHELDKLVGAFTAGRPLELGDDLFLSVDGFVWADRWPAEAQMVRDGKKKLSIEASAKGATCSKCGGDFISSRDYCEHIFSRKAKERFGAKRTLYGLKAKGGAITLSPAASTAGFGKEIYMVASHSDNLNCPYCDEVIVVGSEGECPECGINVEGEISKRENVNPKEGEHKYGDVKFADEKNKKYPIDTAEHIRAAWNYINKAANAAKYSADEVATIKSKIIAAWKDKIDKEGPPSARENQEESSMEPIEPVAATAPDPVVPVQPLSEVDVLKAELAKLTAALEDYQKKLAATEAAKAEIEKAKAELETRYAAKVLGSVLEGEDLTRALEQAKGMSLDQVDLVAKVGVSAKTTRQPGGVHFVASGEVPPVPPEKPKLTL